MLVAAESSALTRFANNRINQNVAEENAIVNVRAVLGKRVGVACTNRLDDASLQRGVRRRRPRGRASRPRTRRFPGLPGPAPVVEAVPRAARPPATSTPRRARRGRGAIVDAVRRAAA